MAPVNLQLPLLYLSLQLQPLDCITDSDKDSEFDDDYCSDGRIPNAKRYFKSASHEFITHADGSRVSIAITRLCDSICLSVRTIKPKWLKLKSPNLADI